MNVIVCTDCKYYGCPNHKKPGSDGLALAAWLVFPLGLPYTLWRVGFKTAICKQCAGSHLVDAQSPSGRKLIALIIGEEIDDDMARSTEAIQFDLFAEPTVQHRALSALPQSAESYTPPEPEEVYSAPEPVSLTHPIEPRVLREPRHQDPDEW